MMDCKSFKDCFEEEDQLLGEGSFGKVKRCRRKLAKRKRLKHLPDEVAVKEISKEVFSTSFESEENCEWNRELSTLSTVKHANIVTYFGHFVVLRTISVVMELCRGTLSDLLAVKASPRRLRLFETRRLMTQLMAGVAHLHSVKIIHRDIKPANILLCGDFTSSWAFVNTNDLVVKLGDFGLSRSFAHMKKNSTTMTVVGTLDFMAPEILEGWLRNLTGIRYSHKSDVWSCGLVAYMMFTGKLGGTKQKKDFLISTDLVEEMTRWT